MATREGFVSNSVATVQLTSVAADGGKTVASSTGTITRGIFNGVHLAPAFIPASSGSVSSVGLTAPNIFSVAGSPVTSAGTLALSLATQTANKVWASATSGGAATPTFRALVAADLPAGTGTVTSVGLSVPGVLFSVASTPVTTSGTIALSLLTQTANTIFAGPSSAGPTAPTFRAMVAADLPSGYDATLMHLAGTETATGAKTFSGGITTGTLNITGGAANTRISTSGSTLTVITNNVVAFSVDSSQNIQIGAGTGAVLSRSAVTGGLLMSNTGGSGNADGKPLFAMFVDTTFGTLSVPTTESHYVATSRTGALQRTLPTPANSSVGQIVYVVQEAAHVFTVGVPAGVTLTMKTGTSLVNGVDVLTTKTGATTFVSSGAGADDGTSAMLVCMSTDTSTVATWRQLGGVGVWT